MPKRDFLDREKEMSAREYGKRDMELLSQVLSSGKLSSLTGGKLTPEFEKKFAEMIGVRYAVAMNSCMSALHAGLIAACLGSGDEVLCDAEFVFGAMAVLYNNAIPVFVDINPVTHNMDPGKIEGAITERTRAIIVTHAWGLPAEIDRIVEIGHKHNLVVIEDCAESILAPYKGRNTGAWGDIGCFSFQASKQISLGDGGMATTNDEKLHKALGEHAGAPTFLSVAHRLAYNYRMTEQTAAIGLAQLEKLPQTIKKLKTNAKYYDEAVSGCKWLVLQRGPGEAVHSFYHWAATFNGGEYGISLEDFEEAVKRKKLSSITIGYTRMPAYKHPLIKNRDAHAFNCSSYKGKIDYPDGLCPVAERVIPRIVLGYVLEPEEVAKKEAEKLREVLKELGGERI